jgi:hypothetical protein
MEPEVAERLKVLTVDPKTVTSTKKIETTTAGAPKPASDLQPGLSSYHGKVEMSGQSMELSSTTEIKAEGDTWVVTESAKLPMGEATDRTVLDKGTLVVRKRTVTQGTVSIELEMKDGKVGGEMKMNGQARPVAVDAGGDLFADGAGSADVIAALPLADGYTTTYRNIDLMKQQIKAVELKVLGTEQVTVPAGTFDAYKIEMTSNDGAKVLLWVAKAPRKVLKQIATVPEMGGATVTSELQK